MANQLFREESIKRVSSPEQLDDYIRVSSPGVWICVAAVLTLLIGLFLWGFLGRVTMVKEVNNELVTESVAPSYFVTN